MAATAVTERDAAGTRTARLAALRPKAPRTMEEAGLSHDFLTQLLLKVMHFGADHTGLELARRVPTAVVYASGDVAARRQARRWLATRYYRVDESDDQRGVEMSSALKNAYAIGIGLCDGLARAGQQIAAGESLTETFRNLGMFPPLVIRMLRVGENTGALDTSLLNITYFYNRDVKESVDKAQKMIGPVMTVVLGGLLAFVVWAVLGPVYDILGKIRF